MNSIALAPDQHQILALAADRHDESPARGELGLEPGGDFGPSGGDVDGVEGRLDQAVRGSRRRRGR